MNLADILKDIGNEGTFQIAALLILAMPKMPIQWSMTMMSYAAYEPDWCCVPEHVEVNEKCQVSNVSRASNPAAKNLKPSFNTCKLNSTACSRRIFFDSDGASTAVTEWDLVCDHQWIVSSLSSIQMGGVMVGAFVSGSLADHFGRKRVHFATILTHALFNLGAGLSNSWPMFAVFRFLIGAAIGGYLVVHVPYILEFVSPRWRVIPASLPFAAIGASLLPFAAWLLPDWRWMHFICAIFCAPFLLGYFYLPESVRWLTIKGRVEEAAQVVDMIARMNKKQYNHEKCFKKIQKIAQREKEYQEKGKKYSYLDVYRDWEMARLTLTLQFVWFTTSLVGYGIIFGISSLAGNVYVNMFLVEAVEIPFIMATYYFNNCIGRRYTAIAYFCLSTVTGFLAFVFHLIPHMSNKGMVITMMCISCRVFVAGAAAVFIVVSTEVYPTVIRTLGFGASNTAAKVGGVLAPFIINMDAIPTVSYTVMFVTCLLCVAAVLSLKETKNLVMEDTLEMADTSLSSSLEKSKTLRRSISQPRIIIDFDVDLIHHRSYSEFEDDHADENDDVRLVKKSKKRKERSPLLRQRHLMYDPCLSSSGHTDESSLAGEKNDDDSNADIVHEADNASDADSGECNGNLNNAFREESVGDSIHSHISSQLHSVSMDNSAVNDLRVEIQDNSGTRLENATIVSSVCDSNDGQVGIDNSTNKDTENRFVQEY